ncbi:hypothetical protein [Oceanithermus sp.]
MNRTRWIGLFFLFTIAWAMPLTQLYDQMAPKLEAARTELKQDPAASLQAIDDALNIFRNGAKGVPEALSQGVVQALKNARIAISRKSEADLESQLWVVRGSLGKMLYEAMFQATYKGNTDEALALLNRLIEITARTPDLKRKAIPLIKAGSVDKLRTLFERAYAEAIYKTLELARKRKKVASSFALTAKAYGLYLVVQDSPRIDNVAKDFIDALAALQQGDRDTFNQKTAKLMAAAQKFFQSAGGPVVANVKAKPAQPATKQPQPAAAPAPAPAAPAAPAPATKPAAAPAAAPKPAAASPAPTTAKVTAKPLVNPLDQLEQDLSFLIGNKKKVERVANLLAQSGIYSFTDWRNSLLMTRGLVATAIPYTATGNPEEAKKYLTYARSRYVYEVSPLVQAIAEPTDKTIIDMFNRLINGVGLRTSDVNMVIDLLMGAEQQVLGEKPTAKTQLNIALAIEKATFGLPRAIFFIVVGVLALFPLYLIYLAFGGRNIYWRLLGLAFFFLLLPALLEGVAYIGDILGTYGGVPALHRLSSASIMQNILAQMAWGLLIFLVVVFASWGLRGIAIQFGLIQDRRQPSTTMQTGASSTSEANPTLTSETIVEWDEEF